MWSKVGIGGEHHRYYKHTKFRQNPRGDPKFLVDLTRNDPIQLPIGIMQEQVVLKWLHALRN